MSIKNWLISIFVVLNLVTIANANLFGFFGPQIEQQLRQNLAPMTFWRYQYAQYWLSTYAHIVGLDNRWEMFSILPKYSWWFQFKGKYEDNHTEWFPLPRQTSRNFLEEYFFDFKEAKFHINMFVSPEKRIPYANFLCRTYAQKGGSKIKSILVQFRHIPIAHPQDVAVTGTPYLQGETKILEEIPCD